MNPVNARKSLLFIVTQGEWGGAQRYIFDLAAGLKNEFKTTVAAGSDSRPNILLEKIQKESLPTYEFKHLKREINPWQDILATLEIAGFLRQNHFDIVHLNSSKAGVIGALANTLNKFLVKNPRAKIIYTAHGWAYLEPLPFWRRWIYLVMEKIAARLRDTAIVLSQKEKDIALRHKTARANSTFVIPNGLNFDSLKFLPKNEARQALALPSDALIIGAIANLYKTKGLNYLIEAAALVLKKYKVLFAIIGEGQERENLELKIKNCGVDQQFFLLGHRPNACQYLQALDIFVLPSLKEGFPYTILEALAAGLPIIATPVGAILEILENEKSGLLMPLQDAEMLAEKIELLLNNPELRKELGQKAKEKVKEFSLEKMIEKTKTVYYI